MTTHIIIVNKGPDPIKIEVQDRDSLGKFVMGEEISVPAGGFKETYLTETRSLQLIEVKTKKEEA